MSGTPATKPARPARRWDGQIFTWEDGTAPGEAHPNCQCWAEPAADDAGEAGKIDKEKLLLEIANLLLILIPAGRVAKIGKTIVGGLGEAGQRILRRAESEKPPTPPKPQEKPPELTPEQQRNLKRFEDKLPKDAGPAKITKLPDGKVVYQADVPARNIPGSYARYEKTVDAAGNTISYTKTTYGPDGSIIHTKTKY